MNTVVDVLRHRVQSQPNRHAFSYLIDGEDIAISLTYRELDQQARTVGALLQRRHAKMGERALLVYPPGLDFLSAFFGCLYAGVVAVPVYPPTSVGQSHSLSMLTRIVHNVQPVAILTISSVLRLLQNTLFQASSLNKMPCFATDLLTGDIADFMDFGTPSRSSIAFIQYTSGSTTVPRGVVISHENLMHNLGLIQHAANTTEESRLVSWLPIYHDMGLVTGILQPVYNGFPALLMSPFEFLKQPIRWLRAITRIKATHSGGPNFAYDLCIRKIRSNDISLLDLTSWEVAFNGSEPIRVETLDRFSAIFEACGFRREAFLACYGLAEATVGVSWSSREASPTVCTAKRSGLEHSIIVETSARDDNAQTFVSCGIPPEEMEVVIVNIGTATKCMEGEIGEIWVSGPSVAQGYWNSPDDTVATFGAYLADTGQKTYLRTGDLGFKKGDELFVAGRLKDLIIIYGRNFYPSDIEHVIELSHPQLRKGRCVAFSVDVTGQEELVIVAEALVDRQGREPHSDTRNEEGQVDVAPNDVAWLKHAIEITVFEYFGLSLREVVILEERTVPVTSSGKLQRTLCRLSYVAGELITPTKAL